VVVEPVTTLAADDADEVERERAALEAFHA